MSGGIIQVNFLGLQPITSESHNDKYVCDEDLEITFGGINNPNLDIIIL